MTENKIVELDLELITDVCLSTSNRTLGEPETFTCVPGRTLWGAAASFAYRGGMSEAEAFRIFHQGSVRIHDAVPLVAGQRAYPVPRSWHSPKNAPEEKSYEAHNFVLKSVRSTMAEQQCRPLGFDWFAMVDESAIPVEVPTARSMRTSMDASGSPRDGLLFGIPVIQAGTRFRTAVSGPGPDVDAVVNLLVSSEVRVGRSRNSEMGLVRLSTSKTPTQIPEQGKPEAGSISFLCASRCLLRNPETGSPTTTPFASAFGLPADWVVDEGASFIRTARIVHFNSKRTRPETDRFAIERGSVITFKKPGASADIAAVQTHVKQGVGEHRGQGYGEVLVTPAWLTRPSVLVNKFEPSPSSAAPTPSDKLFEWARDRAQARQKAVAVYSAALAAAATLRPYGVPPAQWGALHKIAREARFRVESTEFKHLFSPGGYLDSGARKLSPKWKRAKIKLKEFCEKVSPAERTVFLEHLAGACMRDTVDSETRSNS